MRMIDPLLLEFDRECSGTRKCLERLPADKLAWKPHEKSMSLGQLAGHVATIPAWIGGTLLLDGFDLAAGMDRPPLDTPENILTRAILGIEKTACPLFESVHSPIAFASSSCAIAPFAVFTAASKATRMFSVVSRGGRSMPAARSKPSRRSVPPIQAGIVATCPASCPSDIDFS